MRDSEEWDGASVPGADAILARVKFSPDAGRERVERLFRFLQEFQQIRHPICGQIREQPWHLWLRDLPDHPAVRIGSVLPNGQGTANGMPAPGSMENETNPDANPGATRGPDPNGSEGAGREDDKHCVLRVQRPNLAQAPRPPEALQEWLERGWDDPAREVKVREGIFHPNPQGEWVPERFADAPERVQLLESWKRDRDAWALAERPARAAMKVFEQLYEVYGRLQREGERYELMLGDGIVSWRLAAGGVYHPILLQRVQLEFDPAKPEFVVSESDTDPELYTALIRQASDLDPDTLARVKEELEQGRYSPLGGDDTAGFLRRLVQAISPRGKFLADELPRPEEDDPVVGRSPVLFLRERMLGFVSYVDRILDDIKGGSPLPGFLTNIVGIQPDTETGAKTDAKTGRTSGFRQGSEDSQDVLFTKDWNQEQIEIARRLATSGAVVVQGPPGTGKTHTIANLIGHLLASGKSVLVTAHSTKALRVVREKVVEPLQALCVSVLDSDLESRRQLEDSVNQIVERLSRSSADQLDEEARELRNERRDILERIEQKKQDLLKARWAEYREIVIGGQTFSPADAARKVAEEREQNSWIPCPIEPDCPLPLSTSELRELYRTNVLVSTGDEKELGCVLPDPDSLPTPEEYERLLDEAAYLDRTDRCLRQELWDEQTAGDEEKAEELELLADALERLAKDLPRMAETVRDAEPWQLAACWAGLKGQGYREVWEHLLEAIQKAEDRAREAQEVLFRYNPQLAEDIPLEEQARLIQQILKSVPEDGRVSSVAFLTHPAWRRLARSARVGGHSPSTATEFRALQQAVTLTLARRDLLERWDHLISGNGGPRAEQLGAEPEQAAAQFVPSIRQFLNWAEQQLEPALQRLRACGFRWDSFLAGEPPELRQQGELLRVIRALTETIPPILASRLAAARWGRLQTVLKGLHQQVADAATAAPDSETVKALQRSVAIADSEGYRQAYQQLVRLHRLNQELRRRHDLLARLEKQAPAWARAIRERRDVHGGADPPGDPEAAWLWRQLDQELTQRASLSIQELQDDIDRLTTKLRDVTTRLVETLAWARQIRRTTVAERQALYGWLNTVRRIGKGYTKRAPQLRAEAARAMAQARKAVPVWIMPLARVFEQFDPRVTRFDVVIVDEASQSDITALAALYLGKQVVVVGDNEQVSPDAVGEMVERLDPLIREHLQGIPNAKLYDGRRSLYDIAVESFGGSVMLLEHFRCVPDIIQFSNSLSYNGRIKPLREASSTNLKPPVVPYRVEGHSVGKVNEEEAWVITSLIVALTRVPEYANKTVGVISLVGEEQALEIDRLLRQYLPGDEYHRRRILCGTSAQFQGDERHIMFLSMVDSPHPDGGPLALRQDDRFKQRFNVAASRAQDQMWVIYSLDPEVDLKPGDLRRRLIEHALHPEAISQTLDREERRTESEFEKEVLHKLASKGYRVRAQWPVGYYRIDLVVEGGGKRLAIECDGDRYHTLEKLEADLERQAVLERLGWRFVRLRGSEFFRDPDDTMQRVFARLEEMGIPPEEDQERREIAPDDWAQPAAQQWPAFVETVIRLAAQLRQEWRQDSTQETGEQGKQDEQESAAQPDRITQPARPALRSAQLIWPTTASARPVQQPVQQPAKQPTRPARQEELFKASDNSRDEAVVAASSALQKATPRAVPQEDLVEWVDSTTSELWYRLARWAKVSDVFEAWERKLIYDIGRYVERGWKVSTKQAWHAWRLYSEAVKQGLPGIQKAKGQAAKQGRKVSE